MITWRGLCAINTVRTNEQIFFITFLTKTLIYFWRYSFDFKQNLTGVSWIEVSAEVSPFTSTWNQKNRNHRVWRLDESKSSYRNWDSNQLYRYSVFNNWQICAMSNRLALLFTYSILWQNNAHDPRIFKERTNNSVLNDTGLRKKDSNRWIFRKWL